MSLEKWKTNVLVLWPVIFSSDGGTMTMLHFHYIRDFFFFFSVVMFSRSKGPDTKWPQSIREAHRKSKTCIGILDEIPRCNVPFCVYV